MAPCSSPSPPFRHLPPAARLFVAALRAARIDLLAPPSMAADGQRPLPRHGTAIPGDNPGPTMRDDHEGGGEAAPANDNAFHAGGNGGGPGAARRCTAWEDSEVLALCDAVGLRRCAAARLGACAAFLLRESAAGGRRLCLAPPGATCLTSTEVTLAAAIAAPAGPQRAARRSLAGWLPTRRRLQGLVLLDLAAKDLAAWSESRAVVPPTPAARS